MPFILVALFIIFTGEALSQSNAHSGAPGPNDQATQQVQIFVKRSEGTLEPPANTSISDMKAHLLACITINGTYEVRELAVTKPEADGTYHIKIQDKDYELISAGALKYDGGKILFEGSCDLSITISPEKAPPAGQKPKIKMGYIRTYLQPGKPKYIAGLQAAEVTNPNAETKQEGISVDVFLYMR